MANIRALNRDKYNISKYRFKELYYFCLQYDEWKQKLEEKSNPLKGTQYSEMPSSGFAGSQTERIAIECAEYSGKCAIVEAAAIKADPELYEYILLAVTNENVTFNYLKLQKNMPCERDRYYNSRRKFYYYMNQILKNAGK